MVTSRTPPAIASRVQLNTVDAKCQELATRDWVSRLISVPKSEIGAVRPGVISNRYNRTTSPSSEIQTEADLITHECPLSGLKQT